MANLTDVQISSIREKLIILTTQDAKLTDRQVGKEIGYSPGAVNTFKNDKYQGNIEQMAEKIQAFIERYSNPQKDDNRGKLQFAVTTSSLKIFTTVKYCIAKSKLGLITGDPGLGKTISLMEYCNQNPSSIMIHVVPLVTVGKLLRDICTAMRIPTSYYKNNSDHNYNFETLFQFITTTLQDTSRPLIIDEGENLNLSSLEIIRRIHDLTNSPVILSGTERLERKLKGERGQLKQLYSRIGIHEVISKFTHEDVKAILKVNFPEALGFASTFLQVSKQNGRMLNHLIDLVKNNISVTGEPISNDLIDLAAKSLIK